MRSRSLFTPLVVLAALAIAPVAPAGASASLNAKSAAQILALASSAMRRAGSFREVENATIAGSIVLSVTTNSALSEGSQVEQVKGASATARLFGTTLFLLANKQGYARSFGVKNSSLAGKWVLVPSTNSNYADITTGILVPSVIQELNLVTKVTKLGPAKVNGVETEAVQGVGEAGTEDSGSAEAVYVSTTAPYLPVGVIIQGKEDGTKVASEILFSKWGEKIALAKPATYVTATKSDFP